MADDASAPAPLAHACMPRAEDCHYFQGSHSLNERSQPIRDAVRLLPSLHSIGEFSFCDSVHNHPSKTHLLVFLMTFVKNIVAPCRKCCNFVAELPPAHNPVEKAS